MSEKEINSVKGRRKGGSTKKRKRARARERGREKEQIK